MTTKTTKTKKKQQPANKQTNNNITKTHESKHTVTVLWVSFALFGNRLKSRTWPLVINWRAITCNNTILQSTHVLRAFASEIASASTSNS